MNVTIKSRAAVALALLFVGALLVYGWTPLPVKQDRLGFMPGSQPGTVNLESTTRWAACGTVTGTSFADGSMTPGSTSCYSVSTFKDCGAGATAESAYGARVRRAGALTLNPNQVSKQKY